uniref:Glycine N-acyltransferase-like protein n=1 Tax=Sarcophilus harrisii TaxID=9305 RepID=A0A7N4P649_SARHA
ISAPLQILHFPSLAFIRSSASFSFPSTLEVYGSIYFIIHGNPFNLEVVVDSWPDYQTVITRPKKKEMVDKLDQYTNTYHIFTKDFHKCQQFLETPGIIDWNQVIQIQGNQSWDKILRKIATSKSLQIEHLSNILFFLFLLFLYSKNLDFKFTSLNASHAKLVNDNWSMGLNEKSLNYVLHCIKNLPSFCLLNSEGNPISWYVLDQTCEIRMGFTLPKYQAKGIGTYLGACIIQYLRKEEIPFFLHTEEKKKYLWGALTRLGFCSFPHGWNQWKLTPPKEKLIQIHSNI